MRSDSVFELTEKLIQIPSVTGKEKGVTDFLRELFRKEGWTTEVQEVLPDRCNLFVGFGKPRIVFSTHTDVVPGPSHLFTPRVQDDRLFGRGACDAKGILATMVINAKNLLAAGKKDFGLLFVVGEEVDGIGALQASEHFGDRGIKYLVNGEPTEGKLVTAHKGAVGCRIRTSGKACHSGYPELGADANHLMLRVLTDILALDLGSDPELGKATINPGRIEGGLASNVVSPFAHADILVRTVSENSKVIQKIAGVCAGRAEVEIYYDAPRADMLKLEGFERTIVSYCTDVPNFRKLGAEFVLFGPGTIHVAHTDHEVITRAEIDTALDGYFKIFEELERRH